MDRSLLAARIQEILKGRPRPAQAEHPVPAREDDEAGAFAARCAADAASSDAADVLGGEVIEGPAGRAFVVDRRYPPAFRHGRRTVEEYASATAAGMSSLPAFVGAPGPCGQPSGWPLFFDLETTGLSGGAGTYAFLVGCASFEGGELRTRQFFLRGYGEEYALLEAVRAFVLERSGAAGDTLTAGGMPAAGRQLPAVVPPCLITYNGKAFDLPLIETRYLFHRRTSPFASLPHADMLFAARRLWRRRKELWREPSASRDLWREPSASRELWREASASRELWREASASRELWREASASRDLWREASGSRDLWREPSGSRDLGREASASRELWREPSGSRSSCALAALEQDILGLQRQDDVPGWEIPSRYFGYTRTGDAGGLVAVLEHNRLDLLSLAAVSAVILQMIVEQGRVVRHAADALGLARLLEYLGRASDAERCYERAAQRDGLVEGEADRLVRAEALHWLALHRRRARRFDEAAEAWRAIIEIPAVAPALRREACEALAVHHEHRAKDFPLAQSFALRALDLARGGRFEPEVEHRLDRLSRKLRRRRPADDGPTQPAFPVVP